jgi:hypothetical protein
MPLTQRYKKTHLKANVLKKQRTLYKLKGSNQAALSSAMGQLDTTCAAPALTALSLEVEHTATFAPLSRASFTRRRTPGRSGSFPARS